MAHLITTEASTSKRTASDASIDEETEKNNDSKRMAAEQEVPSDPVDVHHDDQHQPSPNMGQGEGEGEGEGEDGDEDGRDKPKQGHDDEYDEANGHEQGRHDNEGTRHGNGNGHASKYGSDHEDNGHDSADRRRPRGYYSRDEARSMHDDYNDDRRRDSGGSSRPRVVKTRSRESASASAAATATTTTNNEDDVENDSFIHLRILLASREAVSIIGRGGSVIAKIRDAAKVKLNVSDNVPGAADRVLNLRGPLEFVAKAAGLVVRTLVGEEFDEPSAPESESFSLRVLMPNALMGCLIGRSGCNFRKIEEYSAAKMRAHDKVLPHSTDRYLIIDGVADAIHIAVFYICKTYLANADKLAKEPRLMNFDPGLRPPPPPPGRHHYSPHGPPMHHDVPPPHYRQHGHYDGPSPGGGRYGHYSQGPPPPMNVPEPYYTSSPRAPQPYGNPGPRGPPYGGGASAGGANPPPPPPSSEQWPAIVEAQEEAKGAPQDQELTQKVRIPKESIGSVIGKGGAQIKGIRQFSGSLVRVEPEDEQEDRLITIQGMPDRNQVALYLVSTRIEASKSNNRPPPA